MNEIIEAIVSETQSLSTEDFLQAIANRFGQRIALASSMSCEDQVLTDMISRLGCDIGVFTIDTGRLPQSTYDLIDATRNKYDLKIQVLFPDREQVEHMVWANGMNLFHHSVEARKMCCYARKVVPLQRKLATLDAWVTGLRRQQAVTRSDICRAEWDEANELVKLNPLADWTTDQVWKYIHDNDVPYNELHDQGYPSIGCAPCTRAVEPGQDIRAGRWWWEEPEHKECGLHVVDGRLVRSGGDSNESS